MIMARLQRSLKILCTWFLLCAGYTALPAEAGVDLIIFFLFLKAYERKCFLGPIYPFSYPH
jgi:hypothetical protein